MRGQLMQHAAKGKGGDHVATSSIDVIGGKEYWIWVEGFSGYGGPNRRENVRQSCGDLKTTESYGWKLFHRE
jgi:hypothetical protein